jgi:hypothetical protein
MRRWHDVRMRGQRDESWRNNQPAQDDERAAEGEDDEKAVQREATQHPAGEMRQREGGAVIGRQKDEREARREDERAA